MSTVAEVAGIVLAAVVGFGVGSLSPATWIARVLGADLSSSGSGNPGATNAGRVLGRRWGLVVALLDVLKGLVPTLVFLPVSDVAAMTAGAAAVLGHCYSPWLRGRGGKGVATSLGAILGVDPLLAGVVLTVFVLTFVVTRWVALASVTAAASLTVAVVVLVVEGSGSVALVVWGLVLTTVVVLRHRPNLLARLSTRRD